MLSPLRGTSVTLFALALAGCPGPSPVVADAAPDVASDGATMPDSGASDAGFEAAAHLPLPEITDLGGARLPRPAVVTITFAGDPRRAALEAYSQWIVGSDWLRAVGAEYGVEHGTVGGAVQLPMNAPATMTSREAEALIVNGVRDGSIPVPAEGQENALYILHTPAGTAITDSYVDARGVRQVQHSCVDFYGYHYHVQSGLMAFAYAVIPACAASIAPDELTPSESVELATSHELIEAATDANPIDDRAWVAFFDDTDPRSVLYFPVTELADLCASPPVFTREGGHVAQRSWSRSAAAAGLDPCVPADPTRPYFSTDVTPNETIHIAPGGYADLELLGWSIAPVPDWRIYAYVVSSTLTDPALTIRATPSTTVMNNDRTATLRITMPFGAPAGTRALISLDSRHSAADYRHSPIVVVSP